MTHDYIQLHTKQTGSCGTNDYVEEGAKAKKNKNNNKKKKGEGQIKYFKPNLNAISTHLLFAICFCQTCQSVILDERLEAIVYLSAGRSHKITIPESSTLVGMTESREWC